MDPNTVYIRTAKGEAELGNEQLSLELHDILSRVDGKTGVGQMMQDAAFWSEQTFEQALNELLEGGYVRMSSETAAEEERAAPLDAAPKEQELPVEAARSAGKSKFAESKRTLIASVLFLDIVEYTKHPVADQFRMKEDFNRLVYQLVQKIPEDDRIIIDTGDGAALGFLADPEEVLFIAVKLRDTLEANDHQDYPDLYVRMGINLGPIKLVADMNGRENLIGDGVNDASRIMGFAKGDQILISRSFHDVVSRLSSEHSGLFKYQGVHRDKHRREHEIYEVGGGARAAKEETAEEKTEEAIRAERLAKMKAKLEAAAKAEAEAKAARAAREALEAESRKPVQAQTKAEKPRSAPRKKGRGIGRVAIALALIIAATAGILPFVPLEFLAKDAERTIADKTGEAVTVGSASLVLLPTPRIVLKAVSIGQDLKIAKLTEMLFGPKPVRIDGATADQDALSGISNWKAPAQKVELEQVFLSLNGKQLPAFGGEVDFAEDGAFRHASINSAGMKAEIAPGESGVNIELDAKNWKLPLGPECPWTEIHARGIASGNEVRIASIEASGYGGDWSGSGKISWGDGWRGTGTLKGKQFDIEQLLPCFSKGAKLKGTLEFDAAVASGAANFNGLFDSPGIEAAFRIRSGVIGNVDIAQAIQTPSPGGSSGGETKFDVLSGNLSASGGGYRYSQLKMTSGIMKASGEFAVREGKLSGNMAVFLNQMHLPLRLDGSLVEPVLR